MAFVPSAFNDDALQFAGTQVPTLSGFPARRGLQAFAIL